MVQPRATRWGEERQGLDRVLTCRCWDCAAYRRHLLRRLVLVALLLGLTGGWAFRAGAWNGAVASDADAVDGVETIAWL
jgi:hypothetical protein